MAHARGMDAVWKTIDKELKAQRLTWAWLGRHLEPDNPTIEQAMNNWARRRVPSNRYFAIASALGWTVEELIAGERGGAAKQVTPEPSDLSPLGLLLAEQFDRIDDPDQRQRVFALFSQVIQIARYPGAVPATPDPVASPSRTPVPTRQPQKHR